MANLRAEQKRAIASAIARNTTVQGLKKGLQEFQDAAFVANKSGKFLASSSGEGHSAMFAILQSMPPDEILGFSQELLETFDSASAALVTGGNATPADAQVLAAMFLFDNFTGVTRTQTDFGPIRIPTTYGGVV